MGIEKFDFPVLRFVELAEKTEDELRRFIIDNDASSFLVCLRAKYSRDKEWEYMIEFCRQYEYDGIMWEMDWFEGQQQVEYLGICPVPGWYGGKVEKFAGIIEKAEKVKATLLNRAACPYCHSAYQYHPEGSIHGKRVAFRPTASRTDFKDWEIWQHKGETPCMMCFDRGGSGAYIDINYCPMCGRDLRGEADGTNDIPG